MATELIQRVQGHVTYFVLKQDLQALNTNATSTHDAPVEACKVVYLHNDRSRCVLEFQRLIGEVSHTEYEVRVRGDSMAEIYHVPRATFYGRTRTLVTVLSISSYETVRNV